MNNLKEIITKDGSISLRSAFYNESFHSHQGALKEAQTKFIDPSRMDKFKGKPCKVLDICFGLGYNSALLFKNIKRQSSRLEWYGLEIDKRPLEYALSSEIFTSLWDKKIIDILNSLLIKNFFKDKFYKCNLLWGDARKEILRIPKGITFDLIFLDAFSPQKCPEIWTVEFLSKIKSRLNSKGSLITYTSSAAVRKTLIDLKFQIFNIKPNNDINESWSNGTLGKLESNKMETENNIFIENLTNMQIEHLFTKSSVPYRDPQGVDKSEDILTRRRKEQSISKLKKTNLWRKKWEITK